MRDILPDEVELRDAAVREIVAVYRAYGFRRIETPALEHLTLLAGSEGGENEKLIFKVMKRGEELESARRAGEDVADLRLRFDLTVPLARYYAENHARLPDPLKAIQIGPVWRAERPQKGRFRQFTQCDIDVLGLASPLVEIELILATTDALARLGLSGLTVRINDRRLLEVVARHCGFAEAAHAAFFIAFDKLDRLGAEGVLGRLLGREVPASGFSIGFERLISILGERGGVPGREGAAAPQRRVALLVDDSGDVAAAVRAAKALRAEGYLVSLEVRRKNVKKQLDDLLTHGFWGYAALDDPARAPQVKPLVRRAEAK